MNTDDFILRSILYSHCLLSHLYKSSGGSMKDLRGPEIYGRASGDRLEAGASGTPDTPRFLRGGFLGGHFYESIF